jgi:hypothetical protein
MHTGATCRPDMDRSKDGSGPLSLFDPLFYGPFAYTSLSLHTIENLDLKQACRFFLPLPLPALDIFCFATGGDRAIDKRMGWAWGMTCVEGSTGRALVLLW